MHWYLRGYKSQEKSSLNRTLALLFKAINALNILEKQEC